MDREANLDSVVPPAPPPTTKSLPRLVAIPDAKSSTSFSSSSSSSPELLRNFQAAFKRHRSLRSMQTNNLMPKRVILPQSRTGGAPASSNAGPERRSQDTVASCWVGSTRGKSGSAMTPPCSPPPAAAAATVSTITKGPDSFEVERYKPKPEALVVIDCKENQDNLTNTNAMGAASSNLESLHVDVKRKAQFSTARDSAFQGADDQMATGLDNLSSHMGSLALTEMEWDPGPQVETSSVIDNDSKYRSAGTAELEFNVRSDVGATSLLGQRTMVHQDELHHLRNFLVQPATQSSVVGTSCATTTSVHSTSAPMLNSMTYCSRLHQECGSSAVADSLKDGNVNVQHKSHGDMEQLPLQPRLQHGLTDQIAGRDQASTSAIDATAKELQLPKEHQGTNPKQNDFSKNSSYIVDKPTKERVSAHDVSGVQSETALSKNPSSDLKPELPKAEKQEKAASSKGASGTRKRNYDPDLFFKVNGKLYQRLGKIGSGGSSEVHKVISSDCTIYALKKIKLKGRDYATAFGFCQEIEYLNRLKGKNNIIQLTDYEVTDKALLHEVISGHMSNKDARVKDDGCIYMVLEYGEIDLAHMLSQKRKEMDGSNQTLDENWLRFYWQQILLAVNTIHEERIVHSDLKPANFLLVRGSLKLIDFGIAKAIMSDTTNIQRDSQVGTLSYMSPEAFMCNESDENGNTIKCGRPSDIWSLGCILYQMVYGRTPFSEYKTFWAKFKVITDPNHEITYEPVSNPWLLDLMRKCLAWDRNDRWRIPQLLQHPFLVPPVPTQPAFSQEEGCELLGLFAEVCASNHEASKICYELQQLVRNSSSPTSQTPESLHQQRKLQLSKLRECLTN